MNGFGRLIGALGVALWLAESCQAIDSGWDARLASRFSSRIREIDKELAELEPQLKQLPEIPIDDQGGTGGFVGKYLSATPPPDKIHAVELRWVDQPEIDLVALVPVRRYDATGLDASYGMPDAFSVELMDARGNVISRIAAERHARSQPLRKGHPFVYQVSPPVTAAGLRISAEILPPNPEDEANFIHAWSEAFVFSGTRDVALGADVKCIGGSDPRTPWLWSNSYLVDGETPLGLPEVPAGAHGNIGWMSEGRDRADKSASLSVDLGEVAEVDAVRLLPAKRPTSDLPNGFGFPRKIRISVSDTGDAGEWKVVAEESLRNPGNNPVLFPFPAARGRHVKVEAVELWKAYPSFPAFFALSEVEVLSGDRNLALGKPVRSPDGMVPMIAPGGRFWSGAALSDGFGPDGKLVPAREWLSQLDRRLQVETRIHDLRAEAAGVVADWRRAGIGFSVLMGIAGAFTIIALPIRYRIHSHKELLKVRERIAGDLHDEVGSNLGSIQMFADLAEGRSGPSDELKRIQRIAAETVSAVRDIVWLLRPGGEHRIGTVEHLRETSSIMLESLDWHFHANEEAWQVELPEEDTRHLFLFYREALHNIMRHAKATRVDIHVDRSDGRFQISIADNGVGIASEKLDRSSTLRALRQRTQALDAELKVDTKPGNGTHLTLVVPLHRKRQKKLKPVEPAPENT